MPLPPTLNPHHVSINVLRSDRTSIASTASRSDDITERPVVTSRGAFSEVQPPWLFTKIDNSYMQYQRSSYVCLSSGSVTTKRDKGREEKALRESV